MERFKTAKIEDGVSYDFKVVILGQDSGVVTATVE